MYVKKAFLKTLIFIFILITLSTIVFADTGTTSSNIDKQNYWVWANTVNSYLVQNQDNTYIRIENINNKLYVETYDLQFNNISKKEITMELPIFGGFYSSKDYNFVVFGQENKNQINSLEVFKVVKYSKDWTKLGQTGLTNCNTTVPFDAGSLRMTEYNNVLYIRGAHKMYKSSDGLNHQSNITFSVDMENMQIVDSFSAVANLSVGYVSHSFNQFVLTKDNTLVTVDHGDGYPRAFVLCLYNTPLTTGKFTGKVTSIPLFNFVGGIGQNDTGASVGGFEMSDTSYIVAANSKAQNTNNTTRNIFVTVTPTNNPSTANTEVKWLTNYPENGSLTVSTPHLIKIDNNNFLVMWSENGVVKYILLDGNGNTISQLQYMQASLSDCKPIVSNGNIVWYVTQNSAPKFYTININDLKSGKSTTTTTDNGQTAKQVAESITSIAPLSIGDTKITMPAVPDGFLIKIKSSSNQAISTSGAVYPVTQDTNAKIVFTITKIIDNSSYDTTPISVDILSATKYSVSIITYDGGTTKGTGVYTRNQNVTVVATPNANYTFDGWYENNTKIPNADATYSFIINSNRSLSARFTSLQPEKRTLTIISAAGGTITKGTSAKYSPGENISISSTPNTGYKFKNWSTNNGGTFADSNNSMTSFTMPNNDVTIVANFEKLVAEPAKTYSLAISSGTGGYIVKGPSGMYAAGTKIEVTLAPNSGYKFKNWSTTDGGSFDNITSQSTIFTMPASNTRISGNFEYIGSSTTTNNNQNNNTNNNSTTNNTSNNNSSNITSNNITESINTQNNSVTLNGSDLLYAKSQNKEVKVTNNNVSIILTPDNINELILSDSDKININITPSSVALNSSLVNANSANKNLQNDFYELEIYKNNKQVDVLNSMITLKVDMQNYNLSESQKQKATGVKYFSKDNANQLGGKYTSNNTFEYKTAKTGTYGVVLSDNVTKIVTSINKNSYMLNGETAYTDVAPTLIDNRTMVPLRFIAESIGASVSWDGNKKMVTVKLDNNKTISMVVGQSNKDMDVPPVLVNNRTLVPLRYVAEQLESNVIWNKSDQSIEIYK